MRFSLRGIAHSSARRIVKPLTGSAVLLILLVLSSDARAGASSNYSYARGRHGVHGRGLQGNRPPNATITSMVENILLCGGFT
jgi:hypothetical protein